MQQHTIKLFPKTADITLLRFLSPEWRLIGERQLELSEIDRFVTEVERKYRIVSLGSAAMAALGRDLYDWLDGPAHRWLSGAMKYSNEMTLRIDVEGRMRHLPWELLHDGVSYLCFNAHQLFTPARLVTERRRDIETHNRPLRLLFMACSPENAGPLLDFEREEHLILHATQQHQIELFVEESGSLNGLRYQSTAFGPGYFDVFHLTGHAGVQGNRPCFLMEDDRGFKQEVSVEEIAEAFQGNWPRLIFLSGCRTGDAPNQGYLPSFCGALVRAGAPAVLGWALPVHDVAASLAAAELYGHLAIGKSIDEAVTRARGRLVKERSDDWHLLRLYINATPLDGMVTPLNRAGRARLSVREATIEFFDAGAKMEVCRREFFVGRRRLIQRCLRVLQTRQGDEHYAEGLLLHGMGGHGKSSLAARLCERKPSHKPIIFIGALENPELDFTDRISHALGDPLAIELLNQKGLTLTQRLRNLFLGPLATKPWFFIFDDFEQNLEASGNRYIVKPVALDILRALMMAIREANSESRVIVTSRYTFPLPPPLRLLEEGLESLRGGELAKKLSHLGNLQPGSPVEDMTRARAIQLGAGNLRLLEWLNRVLSDKAADTAAILEAMERKAEEFRESVLLCELLAQLPRACRRMIASLSVYELPFDYQAAAVICDVLDPHLARAVSLGLIESGIHPATGQSRYFVSRVMLPLVEPELTAAERTETLRKAAKYRHGAFWRSGGAGLPEMLEIFRLANAAGEREISTGIGNLTAEGLISFSRYREAEQLCQIALDLEEDYRLRFHLARAQSILGETSEARLNYEKSQALCPDSDPAFKSAILLNLATIIAQQGDFTRALDLRQQSLQLYEKIGDLLGQASVLHEMAVVFVQQGDFKRALDLWQKSLALSRQIGHVLGEATTLSSIADVIAQRGDFDRALDLWRQSLPLFEQIGDARRRASTLHNMGIVLAQKGDSEGALDMWQQSLCIEEQIGDLNGKAATLAQMADLAGKQGDARQANDLWQESLRLLELTGDVKGKASILAQMAWFAGQQGEFEEQRRLNLEAAKSMAALHAWLDLTTVIGNLGISPLDGALGFLAQAVWLAIRVDFPVEDALKLIMEMLAKLGFEHDAAPRLATTALFLIQTRWQYHVEHEKLFQQAARMLANCAAVRKVNPGQYEQWIVGEGLNDHNRFLPVFLSLLESMVGEGEWLFDRQMLLKR